VAGPGTDPRAARQHDHFTAHDLVSDHTPARRDVAEADHDGRQAAAHHPAAADDTAPAATTDDHDDAEARPADDPA